MEGDDSRDGVVSLEEFLAWWMSDSSTKHAGSIACQLHKARQTQIEFLTQLFHRFDTDGNGTLDLQEVEEFCRQIGMHLTPEQVVVALDEMEGDDSR